MESKKLLGLLDKIEGLLGHYSEIGGLDCPFIKTDDTSIKDVLNEIRKEEKSVDKNVFVTNREG